jgi:hypothetical protein
MSKWHLPTKEEEIFTKKSPTLHIFLFEMSFRPSLRENWGL